MRQAVLHRLLSVALRVGRGRNDRKAISASRVLIQADRLNLAQRALELRGDAGAVPTARDVIAEAEAADRDYKPAEPPGG